MQELLQNEMQIQIPTKNCSKNNQAYLVCCSKICKAQNPFVCRQKKCDCMAKEHILCQMVSWESLITQIWIKKMKITKQLQAFSNQIEQIYDQLIQQLSNQKLEFLNWRDAIGLGDYEKQFFRSIGILSHQKQEIEKTQISSNLVSKLLDNHNSKNDEQFVFKEASQLREQWKSNSDCFNKLVKILRKMYTQPKILSKTVKDVKQLNRLFQQSPSHYRLLYQGSRFNNCQIKFHQKCDNVRNTITVIKTGKGSIVGGFSVLPWKSSETGEWIKDCTNKSFTFNEVQNGKINKSFSSTKTIFNYKNWGPTFGSGTDILVYQVKSISESPHCIRPEAYGNRSFNVYSSKNEKQLQYKAIQVQVYEVVWI